MNYLDIFESFTNKVIKDKKEITQEDKRKIVSDYVDLGLPSGTLWCSHNVGVDNEYECGDLYTHMDAMELDLLPGCLPSMRDFCELIEECKQKIAEVNGIKGMMFISKRNLNKIFFPIADHYEGLNFFFKPYGYYWSSDLFQNGGAYNMKFDLSPGIGEGYVLGHNTSYRSYGFLVRSIRKRNTIKESFTSNVINDKKEIKQNNKRNAVITADRMADLISNINTDTNIETRRYPIYSDDNETNVIGFDVIFENKRDIFIDTINGKKVLSDGERSNYMIFRFALGKDKGVSTCCLFNESKRKGYSIGNTDTRILVSKNIEMQTLNLSKLYKNKLNKEKIVAIYDVYSKNFGKMVVPTNSYNNDDNRYPYVYVDNNEYNLIDFDKIIPYAKECYEMYIKLIKLENREIELYKNIEELFEKKNITITK